MSKYNVSISIILISVVNVFFLLLSTEKTFFPVVTVNHLAGTGYSIYKFAIFIVAIVLGLLFVAFKSFKRK